LEINVDARGKACPQPVLMTKKALESVDKGRVIITVDNDIARENVIKLVKNQNLQYSVIEDKGEYDIIIEKGQSESESLDTAAIRETVKDKTLKEHDYAILITKDTLGEGSETLGKLLLKNYLYTLPQANTLPSCILFVNSGVNLTTEGSESLESLKQLQNKGVDILSCGTCLDYYDLKDKLAVGQATNMYEIVERTTKIRTLSI
jgi:selenium metabolism protein YedF